MREDATATVQSQLDRGYMMSNVGITSCKGSTGLLFAATALYVHYAI